MIKRSCVHMGALNFSTQTPRSCCGLMVFLIVARHAKLANWILRAVPRYSYPVRYSGARAASAKSLFADDNAAMITPTPLLSAPKPKSSILASARRSFSSFASEVAKSRTKSWRGRPLQKASPRPSGSGKSLQSLVFYTIIGLNVCVFGAWQVAKSNLVRL